MNPQPQTADPPPMLPLTARLHSLARVPASRSASWLTAFALILALQINPWWWPSPDSALYLSIARNLSADQGLVGLGSPRIIAAPGYPLLISPAFVLSDHPFLYISILHWLLAVTLMLCLFVWFKRFAPEAALLLTGLVVLHVTFTMHNRMALTETAFLTAVFAGTAALHAAAGAQSTTRFLACTALSAGLVAAATGVRLLGVVLPAGAAIFFALQSYQHKISLRRALVVCSLVAFASAGVLAYSLHLDFAARNHQGTPADTYLAPIADQSFQSLLFNWLEGVRLRVCETGRLLIPGMFKAYDKNRSWLGINTVLYIPVFAAVFLGYLQLLRKHADPLALAAPFYLLILTLWPFDQGERFALPLLPLLWLSVWMLIQSRSFQLSLLLILLVLHTAVSLTRWAIDVPTTYRLNRHWPQVTELASILQPAARPLPANEIVAVDRSTPPNLYLLLTFALDRRVTDLPPDPAIPLSIHWLVSTPNHPALPNFTPRISTADLTLLERTAP